MTRGQTGRLGRWWWGAAAFVVIGVVAGWVLSQAHRPGSLAATSRHHVVAKTTPATTPVTVTTLAGGTVRIPDGHPTVLYFMSAQCASCAQGEQQLAAFARQLPPGAELLSLDVTPRYDSVSAVEAMGRAVGATWPAAYATPQVMTAFDVVALDQVAVVTGTGHIVYDGGLPSNQALLQLVRKAGA
jgi:hypothetical protein